ncbi:hypothetical protein [Paraliomyxa miuraensis]|uniref:hypothetical protein n=1 Tax=Paraliomyxa miuraensis TaxID=376150 RepID=UPI00225072B4|nr:hypothetical protein [Paraliomyxa miuraensis]MCX4243758.1 hypothetical protein [Paraliomyxa miuraensis]
MSELGSIFDDEAPKVGAKGPDLRIEIAVRRSDLESDRPLVVSVPERVPHGESSVPRHREVGDPPGEVTLHLSPRLSDGSVLRLRRQGGEHPSGGAPGDLLIRISLVTEARMRWVVVVAAVVLAAVAVAAFAWLG